jgi:hypothetical protein
MDHEDALVSAFIVQPKRARWREKLASPKGREAFLAAWKFTDIDQRYCERIDPHHPKVEFEKRAEADNQRLYELPRKSGAPRRCHVISASSDLDGQEVDLRQAIDEVVGYCEGTFISCIPGRLVFFEGYLERFLLRRAAASS